MLLAVVTATLLASASSSASAADANASQYAVHWPTLLPEPGKNKGGGATYLNSMPLGNGHVAANVLFDSGSGKLVALIASSSAWAESGELMKVALLEVNLYDLDRSKPIAQTLDPQTATFTLSSDGKAVATVYIDANSDTLVVTKAAAAAATLAALRVDAASGVGAVTPSFSCQPYTVSKDVAGSAGPNGPLFVYHRNANCSGPNDYMATTLADENIPSPSGFIDPLKLRATGAAVATSSDGGTTVVAVLTDDSGSSTATGFEAVLAEAAANAMVGASGAAMKQAHEAWWAAKWAGHYIHVSTQDSGGGNASDGARLSKMYALERYTQIIQARIPKSGVTYTPIKVRTPAAPAADAAAAAATAPSAPAPSAPADLLSPPHS